MFVRECYGMVRQLTAWGYPLELQRRKTGADSGGSAGGGPGLDNGPALAPAKLLAQRLEEGSAEGFAEECERFLRQEEARYIR